MGGRMGQQQRLCWHAKLKKKTDVEEFFAEEPNFVLGGREWRKVSRCIFEIVVSWLLAEFG